MVKVADSLDGEIKLDRVVCETSRLRFGIRGDEVILVEKAGADRYFIVKAEEGREPAALLEAMAELAYSMDLTEAIELLREMAEILRCLATVLEDEVDYGL